MERLGLAVNGADNASSAATAIGQLQQALQTYSASPSNRNLAENAIDSARNMVRTLNERHPGDPDIPRRDGYRDRHRRQRAQRSARQFKDANTDIVAGHPQRPRRLRLARPPRRAAEADLQHRLGLHLHAVRQRHGHHDQGRRDAVRDDSAHRHVPAAGHLRAGTAGNSVYIDGIPVAGGRRQHQFVGQDRRPGPTARQRRRHHAEPARRDRARPDHRLRRNRRFRRTVAARGRPLHLARRPGNPAAGTLVDGLAG